MNTTPSAATQKQIDSTLRAAGYQVVTGRTRDGRRWTGQLSPITGKVICKVYES